MHSDSAVCLGAALLLCASAAGSPAPEDSAAEKVITGGTAPTDLEGKGEPSDVQEFRPRTTRPSGRTDTRRGRDAELDADKGSGEVAGETAAEGVEQK